MAEPQISTGCLTAIGVGLFGLALFFAVTEIARGIVWIKWAFGA